MTCCFDVLHDFIAAGESLFADVAFDHTLFFGALFVLLALLGLLGLWLCLWGRGGLGRCSRLLLGCIASTAALSLLFATLLAVVVVPLEVFFVELEDCLHLLFLLLLVLAIGVFLAWFFLRLFLSCRCLGFLDFACMEILACFLVLELRRIGLLCCCFELLKLAFLFLKFLPPLLVVNFLRLANQLFLKLLGLVLFIFLFLVLLLGLVRPFVNVF